MGFACSDPQALNDLDLPGLCQLRSALFVVSTTGQGDPPVNMRRFWQDLKIASLPKTLLSSLRFAVFGLGDTHYREFNYAARKLHARLQGLGATSFVRLGLGDDQHDFGFEQELDPWAEAMWSSYAEITGVQPSAADTHRNAESLSPDRRYDVDMLGLEVPAATPDDCDIHFSRKAAGFQATVVDNRSLCSELHARTQQDVRNIRLSTPAGISYRAGDVCVVWPKANPKLVQRFISETLGLDPRTYVRITPSARGDGQTKCNTVSIFPEVPLTLEDVFSSYVDVSAVPARHFFYVLSLYTNNEYQEGEAHSKKLREFASRTLEAKDALYEYCKREKRSAAEVMWDFWTARPPLAELLSCLPLMRPRRYSIASCPKWIRASSMDTPASSAAQFWRSYQEACGPRWRCKPVGRATTDVLERRFAALSDSCNLDLCVAVVKFTTRNGRDCEGLCSSFLERAECGSSVVCSFESGSLALPPLEVPLIMVCPGTGLSPCRALVQERHFEIQSKGSSSSNGRFRAGLRDLMFLGFRHESGDFLYAEEWGEFTSWLSVYTAFSRDHEDKKVYVQDIIEEHGGEVCDLLDAGARVYVCGRSHPMPAQVFDSFVEVLQLHRRLSLEAATARLRNMQRAQQYICDTWG
eukprot:TRINITY_DN103464_c0_g1_i1.p1 TRINITY_DN103464_c0_g1~~TRINITY_DN103464_c0_g1_i1.p1  ORF type:complete len:677 (+),score=89.13 TRINITY_DN103464_c0_g1_i1:119-2032(+)